MEPTQYFVTLSTYPNFSGAQELANKLVSSKLAACVNIVPKVISIYAWEGEVQQDDECLLIIKSMSENKAALESLIERHHPYDVPEIIHLSIQDGLKSYLDWLAALNV